LRRYGLDEAAGAVRHVEAGHARGETVIVMPWYRKWHRERRCNWPFRIDARRRPLHIS
jgi:hypothetical protein